jgi:hypothetical protein
MQLRRTIAVIAATCSVGLVTALGAPGAQAAPAGVPVLGLQAGNVIISFNAATPGTIDQTTTITGLLDGESIVGFDLRPATGELIAAGVAGTSGHLYVVDALNGTARPISTTAFSTSLPAGGTWALDFNPTVDRVRLVHSSGASYRLNPNNATVAATDTSLAPAGATAVAYDRSTPTTPTATTLFAIDPTTSSLALIGGVDGTPSPNGGSTTTRGSLGVAVTSPTVGFDIAANGDALASMQVGGAVQLFGLDLGSGAATSVGNIGSGSDLLLDLTVQRPATGALVALSTTNSLVRLDAAAPAAAAAPLPITGLPAGETIVGIDVRPATGEVIGVGVTGTSGRLFRIDLATGAATPIGTAPFATNLPAGGTWSVDFNPTVDRVRFVHSTGASYRLNPVNGALGGTDTPVAPAKATAVAYDRSVATTAATTLFAVDDAAATLGLIGGVNGMPSPNAGATSVRGPLGVTPEGGLIGFDITPVGEALATFRVAGSTGLYRIDLASGDAALVGSIGDGTSSLIDVAALPKLPSGAGQFSPVAPSRLLDTRQAGAKPAAGETIDLQVTGVNGVPASATAVVLNVTGTQATADGFLTVFPTGEARPTASNNNLVTDGTKANLTTVKVGAGGRVSIFVDGGAHLVVDVVGYYAPATSAAGRFTAIPGNRVLDTRTGAAVAAGGSVDVVVTGTQGVPATGVAAVMVNLTLTRAAGPGYAVAYATGQPVPPTSSVNVGRADGTASNLAIVPVGTDGKITVATEAGADVLVDVAGWFSDASAKGGYSGLLVPVTPSRILDTRNGVGAPAAPLARQGSLDVTVAGFGGVPAAGASGVAINVTAVDATAPGFLTVFPTGVMWPLASNVNADAAGATVPNLVASPLGSSGRISVFDDAGGHVLIDVAGWFTA